MKGTDSSSLCTTHGLRCTVHVLAALLALAAPAAAAYNSPTLLFETPTADVLPAGSLAISAGGSMPLTNTTRNTNYPEFNANVRFSPLKHLDLAVTAYTFQDYVLDARYQILGGEPGRCGLAVGVYDVGIHSYVSPIGHDSANAWPDWRYGEDHSWYTRTYENLSAFVVTSIPLGSFARFNAGLGRGRFVGYGERSRFLNSDYLFNSEFHQWAVALFGGLEVYVLPNVALVAEASTRDMNTGVKAHFGPISAAVAWTKMEGLIFPKGTTEDPSFGRLDFGVSYLFNNLFRRPEPKAPVTPPEPEPIPEPEPEPESVVATPSPAELKLNPIWFDWDKWDITTAAEATLRQNAEVVRAHPEIKVVIVAGWASEEGTVEHNYALSGRRANAAFEYLKSLGVPARQMVTKAMGESPGRPLPQHRVVYFEVERGK
jgi:hypothetical protein